MTMTALDGRLPSGPSEIAMGRATMDELDVAIGDTVDATLEAGGSVPLVVVGSVVMPPTDEYALDVGAVLTPSGLAAAGTGDLLTSVVLRYPEGADAGELEAALAADYGFDFGPFTRPNPPGSIRNLVESRNIAAALAAFFGVLAAVGLLHALVVSTRRRRVDLAVLRALGFRRAQVRRSISTAALTLAVGGIVIGIPVGVVAGRLVWRTLAADVGAVADPSMPWPLLVGVVPATVGVATLVAWWPGRSAVRLGPAQQLRAAE
jgi:ABC-type lipoprotein release transport system permease subunit